MVSSGQIKVPSGEYLRAASPPLPLVIVFLMLAIMIDMRGRHYFVEEII